MKSTTEERNQIPRLVYYPEIKKLTGLSRSTIWKMEKTGRFPRRRLISTNRVAWLESEVHDWIRSRAEVEGAAIQPKHNLSIPKKDTAKDATQPKAPAILAE